MESLYVPYRYKFNIDRDEVEKAGESEDGKYVVYIRGERYVVSSTTIEFNNDKPLTFEEVEEVTKGTKGVYNIRGQFKINDDKDITMGKTVIEKRDELIDLLTKYGFGITASDKDYTRMIYYDRNEDILADDSVHVVEEKIKIEFDLDDMSFKAKSFLTDENTTAVTGEVSMAGRFPTVEELEDTLVNEYGLEQIVN